MFLGVRIVFSSSLLRAQNLYSYLTFRTERCYETHCPRLAFCEKVKDALLFKIGFTIILFVSSLPSHLEGISGLC